MRFKKKPNEDFPQSIKTKVVICMHSVILAYLPNVKETRVVYPRLYLEVSFKPDSKRILLQLTGEFQFHLAIIRHSQFHGF